RDRNVTGVQTCALPISQDHEARVPLRPERRLGAIGQVRLARRLADPELAGDQLVRPALRDEPQDEEPACGWVGSRRCPLSLRTRSEEHTSELQSRFELV